jgi:DNA-binding IclR family transcriptional regulator
LPFLFDRDIINQGNLMQIMDPGLVKLNIKQGKTLNCGILNGGSIACLYPQEETKIYYKYEMHHLQTIL